MIIKNDRILKSLQYNINLTVVIYKVSNTNIKYIHLLTLGVWLGVETKIFSQIYYF